MIGGRTRTLPTTKAATHVYDLVFMTILLFCRTVFADLKR
jgi:hypothetical protein